MKAIYLLTAFSARKKNSHRKNPFISSEVRQTASEAGGAKGFLIACLTSKGTDFRSLLLQR